MKAEELLLETDLGSETDLEKAMGSVMGLAKDWEWSLAVRLVRRELGLEWVKL